LLLVTTVPTMILAAQGLPSVWLMVNTVIGGTLAAGGANAYNMYIDRDIDALMERTRGRPLVTGEVTPVEALVFATAVEVAAFGWLWATVNLLSAALAVAACAFYVGVYSLWLKRTSSQNIVIGGAAGAVPVLIGWSSVTNTVSWAAVLLFAVIFFWTPPHFWALAIRYEADYSAAAVPMLPVVEGYRATAVQMTVYSVIVGVVSLALRLVAPVGWLYLGAAAVLAVLFTGGAARLALETDPEAQAHRAIRYFTFSITHLTILFAALALDQLVGWGM
jgi:protoheme IX farnesyltransferase